LGTTIEVDSPLIGRHQLRNLALAVASAVELRDQGLEQITPAAIERGIRQTHWPGRFQIVTGTLTAAEANSIPARSEPSDAVSRGPKAESRKPMEYVFDVAHNPAGAWALRSTLSSVYGDRPITMVFGVLRDKAVAEMTEILFPIAAHVIVTHANNPRAATAAEIRQAAARVAGEISEADSVRAALNQAGQTAEPNGLVVVTGSIYIVGEAMRVLGARI
jgi:dihydrofolate synthase/folylpolyglutamate synthase